MKTYVLYHANCADGFGAACAARLKFQGNAEYIPVAYGQPVPVMEDLATVYILDFSYPRAVLLELNERMSDVIVLDHHETARQELVGLNFAIFDMGKSGARLAWEHFHFNSEPPALIRYIEDRDLWRWALPHSREISAGLASYPQDFHMWLDFIFKAELFEKLKVEGAAVLRAQQKLVEMQCRNARAGALREGEGFEPVDRDISKVIWNRLDDEQARQAAIRWWCLPVVNATAHISEVGHALLEKFPDAPVVGIYLDKADGARMWSLRSRKDFDCSVVAKAFGGGGHKQAAGFTQAGGGL